MKIRSALLPHQVLFIAKDSFLLQHSVKEKPETSHLPQWINWLSNTKPFTELCSEAGSVAQFVLQSEWEDFEKRLASVLPSLQAEVLMGMRLHPWISITSSFLRWLWRLFSGSCSVCAPARWPRLQQLVPVFCPYGPSCSTSQLNTKLCWVSLLSLW